MIGELLRLWRSVENIGVRDLAAELGISAATLSRIENGKPCDMYTTIKLMTWLFSKRN